MKAAVTDDFEIDCRRLAELVERYCEENHISVKIKRFKDGAQLLECFDSEHFDLIFLDIYMGELDGIAVAEEIRRRDQQCLLVFATASREHAIQSYRVRAFDYLVKPYTWEQVSETLRLCEQQLLKRNRYLDIKEGREMTRILLCDIIYTDYSNHYIYIYLKDRLVRTHMSFDSFSPLLLAYPQFLCCYRNMLINMDEVGKMTAAEFQMKNGISIPISKARRNEIRQRYADYAFRQLNGGE